MEVGAATALAGPLFELKKVNTFNLKKSLNSRTHLKKYSPFVVKAVQSQNKSYDAQGSTKTSFSKRERRPHNVPGDFFVGNSPSLFIYISFWDVMSREIPSDQEVIDLCLAC